MEESKIFNTLTAKIVAQTNFQSNIEHFNMYTNEEQRHIERLRKHPQLMDRFNSILDVAEADGPGVDTADAVEERTVAEVRKLGNEVMAEWASSKETASRQALKTSTPKAQPFKKN